MTNTSEARVWNQVYGVTVPALRGPPACAMSISAVMGQMRHASTYTPAPLS